MAISVANTAAQLAGKALAILDATLSITGLWTFNRGASAPFAVPSGAAKVANLDADLLDGQEGSYFFTTGSWTPQIAGTGGSSGNAYSGQVGRYVKIGTLVIAEFTVALSTKGTNPGDIAIDNLPFTVAAGIITTPAFLSFYGMSTNWISLDATAVPATVYALLHGTASAGTANITTIANTDLSNVTDLRGVLVYHTT